ncbi:amino acid permease/ SLC12A domain-containing protein [Penicillium angulare]|uniref:Amino acid permease/ SLC12A domain-containing protein n=1 Tax=Penicillium angulare TaxID=116970 RepID=A0A9W9GDE7_9EURO|nr:amino acid permease/ SLC12A domain-containing protein [Penicillium angulare]
MAHSPSNNFENATEKSEDHKEHDEENFKEDVIAGHSGTVGGLHRRLGIRHIQLVAIGGSIGTGLFIAIGTGLYKGGPGSLLLAFIIECLMVSMLNNCLAEMSTYMPVSGGFIGLAGKWCDDALGFMAGWNFFIYMALTVPFEISAVSVLLQYWRDDIPVVAVILVCMAFYATINLLAVGTYGEAEFWLSGGKVLLIFILFAFTFITMVGGNPAHDAYGFRSWNTGGAFHAYSADGTLEAKHPRIYIKKAFQTVYWRFCVFFIGGALCVGILVARNDTTLDEAISSGKSGSTASPYVIAMHNMGIKVLPDLVTALMITTVFSAGNTYTYAASRALHGLAVAGRAPRCFAKTTKNGIPIYSFIVVMMFACLAFLRLSGSAMQVLNWLISLTTANILIDYIVITLTYINFYHACKAQNFDRSKLPYYARFQPYCGYIAFVWMVILAGCFGYESFKPWNTANFFLNYTMILLAPLVFIFWKIYKKTRWLRPHEVDLVWEAELIAAYEAIEEERPIGFWREFAQLLDFRKFYRREAASHPA